MDRPTRRRLNPSGPTASRDAAAKVKILTRSLALESSLVPNPR